MGAVRIFLMGVFGGNSLCCVLFLFGVFDNMPPNIWSYSTAPPSRSLSRRLETAGRSGRVWDSAFRPTRRQKTAYLLHPLSRTSEFCFHSLLRPRSSTCGLRRVCLFCFVCPPNSPPRLVGGQAGTLKNQRVTTRHSNLRRFPKFTRSPLSILVDFR